MIKKNRIYDDLSVLPKRSHVFFILVRILFVIILLYFWKIQILDHQIFWNKSEENRIREILLSPQRGLILDREGRILAKNAASFKASFIRENAENLTESYQRVADLLNMEWEELKRRVERYSSFPSFRPVVIKDNLTPLEVAKMESRKQKFPELIIQAETKRHYPLNESASHILGYLQEISPAELKMEIYNSSQVGDMVGKTGIEKQYESLLRGKKGRAWEIVDSIGRKRGELARTEPVKGKDIRLTIDLDLQILAEELLNEREGAIVVMRPENGEILAMTSYPHFDPNRFINRFTPEEWMELVESKDYPLENRALRGLYSPGSLIKPLIGLAALDSGIISAKTRFHCGGATVIYGHPFSCWYAPGHGALDLTEAIKYSCNIYFYNLGKKLGIQNIADYSRDFGLGALTGIDLPQEISGLVPDSDWKRRVRNEPWYPGETISISIGQGPFLVTPLQMAKVTAAISNRGRQVVPLMLMPEPGNEDRAVPDSDSERMDIPAGHFESVIAGMWRSANRGGTAAAAGVKNFEVCGKTGSTQVIGLEAAEKLGENIKLTRTHSWFSGFAPRDDAKVVVTVIVEYGGSGGATAAPIAGKLFKCFQEKYD
ncbi:MAG: penicillin-binding protein 2 [Candidatus Aminicenantes bacterium]